MSLDFLQLVGQINAKQKTPLSARQIEHARALFNESITGGIDPRLTLSMAWQESTMGLGSIGDPDRGADHALGSMQVLRSTARGLGMEQDWLRNKALFQKTGNTDPATDAKMGVALLKELATKNKATTFGDITAAYNGGPKLIGKNYGNAQGHVAKVASHMGKFFGDGGAVNWKTPIVLAGGVTPTLASAPSGQPMQAQAITPTSSIPATAPRPPASPGVFGDFLNNPVNAPQARTMQPSAPIATRDPLDDITAFLSSNTSSAAPDDNMPFGLTALLPTLQSQQADPMDALRNLLSQEYDKQYQPEEA
jgi:Transglycosylase SLT domain